ncbi:N-methyl-L-tryptophan oxidase [Paenibacillus sp. J31TS4]|uniref:N-methyl-L-tryptophan oxidase n=1 Tax=Paenibacillus sp. J31TS4 TaxID=2807195 RepID=UPI001B23EFBE|nr:N-methyl-L-tryptophan oxidase [Paenibacillus sp. J31TS4]GIP39148.1 N-methyl-L-tryptophan oxidase [Paenibacillus sp. J31TS4]
MGCCFDVIVVGAGAMGMNAGYRLAERGLSVLLLDACDPPHSLGSHHGETRLLRHAYRDACSVPLALRAHRLWSEMEEETGGPLFRQTGVLNLAAADSSVQLEKAVMAERFGLRTELLGPADIERRWPGFSVPDGYTGLYEPTAGVLFSEACMLAARRLAAASGAVLLPYTPVNDITVEPSGVTVKTPNGCFHGTQLVLTTGSWSALMLDPLRLPVAAVRQTVAWFEAEEEKYGEAVFPGFTFDLPDGDFYGVPSIGGSGVKIGRHDAGREFEPSAVPEPFGAQPSDEEELRRFAAVRLPGAAGRLVGSAVCRYERTPDEQFLIDRHPVHGHVWIATGFSGHGFKFASAVGEAVAELVATGRSSFDLSAFSLGRFAGFAPSSAEIPPGA